MPLSAPDLTRQNLLDSPSAVLDAGGIYWLVYATDNPVDLGAVYDALNAASDGLLALGGATQIGAGVAVPVKLSASAPTAVIDSVVDPVRELDLGTDFTLFGLGIGPSLGGGAVLRLTFLVPGTLSSAGSVGGAAAGVAASGSEILAAADQSGALAANRSTVSQVVAKVGSATKSATTSVLGDLKTLVIALVLLGGLYLLLQLRRA